MIKNCKATFEGGAIQYGKYWPTLENVSFENNSASYGSNLASFPVKILINESESQQVHIKDVASG